MPSQALDVLSSLGRPRGAPDFQQLLAERTAALATNAVPNNNVQTEQAVAPATDAEVIDPAAQSVADLQALIERLTSAKDPSDIANVLREVKSFVEQNTGADLIDGVLGQLASLANDLLGALEENPEALGGSGAILSFSGSFSQTSVQQADYYAGKTTLSLSFTFVSADTVFSGSLDFAESYEVSEEGARYASYENVSLGLVSFNTNLETNPALDAFVSIAKGLTGIDVSGLFGQGEQSASAAKPYSNGAYSQLSVFDQLELNRQSLDQSNSILDELIELLREFQEKFLEEASRDISSIAA